VMLTGLSLSISTAPRDLQILAFIQLSCGPMPLVILATLSRISPVSPSHNFY
jgi:hypothetical protein